MNEYLRGSAGWILVAIVAGLIVANVSVYLFFVARRVMWTRKIALLYIRSRGSERQALKRVYPDRHGRYIVDFDIEVVGVVLPDGTQIGFEKKYGPFGGPTVRVIKEHNLDLAVHWKDLF